MSAVWLKLVPILCLSCSARSVPGSSGVVWRDYGESVTIQCRPLKPGQEYLTLKKGLNEENEVFYKDGNSAKNNIAEEFKGRLQLNGVFPNMDILIKNLTSEDTGPYRCVYKKFDLKSSQTINMEGKGSVLLVVTDTACDRNVLESNSSAVSNYNVVLVIVVICAAVLLGLIMCFLIWIILKTKTLRTTKKPRRVTTDDVYEDMRGTIRH